MRHGEADIGGIAIIGVAVHLPGADTPAAYWANLRDGIESVTFFSDAELLAAGVAPAVLRDPAYVKASPTLQHFDRFDAAFFGYSPKEAAIMDPQHRLFLETCWEAVEDAGYDPETLHRAAVGVFAGGGSAFTSYLHAYSAHPEMQGQTAGLQHINTDRDFLSTRVSYKLNLTGPSLTVQTACSTSLVAVHLACQSLDAGECQLALVGASTVRVPHIRGYRMERGGVHSADGHCRPFDAGSTGTVFGSGVVAVLLKPAALAIADRDHIYAVIKATAVNNDGASKISYTAASAIGQARAVIEALEVAGIAADTLGYVECHATGTPAGDPVEVQALTRAFRFHTTRTSFCALGSVKANIGHPEQTAGLAGLVKAALALKHRVIPPNINFTAPNPALPLDNGPFYIPTTSIAWAQEDAPRRAGVNSLGIGGTNAFVVLEEPPERRPRSGGGGRTVHLLCLSAKTQPALTARAQQFVEYLNARRDANLEDICATASLSRSRYPHRLAVVSSTGEELARRLPDVATGSDPGTRAGSSPPAPIAFLFSGQGAQYAGMAHELYESLPLFREMLDKCDTRLRPRLGVSLREVIFTKQRVPLRLEDTCVAQPALFAIEYALAHVWQSWGITPAAVVGHSVGEIAAACCAGVLELEEALQFVADRGALMQRLPVHGSMEVCFADETIVARAIASVGGRLDIAAVNSPRSTVVSGVRAEVDRLRDCLARDGVATRPLAVSHAFHSALVEPILDDLERAAAGLLPRTPRVPVISTVTGQLLTDAPAPYWRRQARHPVRFADAMRTLSDRGVGIFLEIGPGATLLAAARECLPDRRTVWLPSLHRGRGDLRTMLESLAELCLQGCTVAWDEVYRSGTYSRVPLPTYPFERKRHWLDDVPAPDPARAPSSAAEHRDPRDDTSFLYQVRWQKRPAVAGPHSADGNWLILSDRGGLGTALAAEIDRRGGTARVIHLGARTSANGDLDRMLRDSAPRNGRIRHVIALWPLDLPPLAALTAEGLADAEAASLRSALHLVQSVPAIEHYRESRLWFVTRGAQPVLADREPAEPLQAALWGFGRTAALELPRLWGGAIDLAPSGASMRDEAAALVQTILAANGDQQLALRAGALHVPRLEPLDGHAAGTRIPIRNDATYLITGGLGMLGLQTATWLVDRGARALALVTRTGSSDTRAAEVARLEACGAQVHIIGADVSHTDALQHVLEHVRQALPPLKGVVHCAGVLADRVLSRMAWDDFARVTAPKIRGGWLLHYLTTPLDLDFFVVHSSILSLLGSPGQANYTAANAFLDALVDYRRARGLPAMGINWGPWAGGMAAAAGSNSEAAWRARGMSLIGPEFGARVLDRLFEHPVDHAAVAICDWTRYVLQLEAPAPLCAGLAAPEAAAARARPPGDPAEELRARLATASPDARRDVIGDALQHEVVRALGLAEGIDRRQPLQQLGVDSLMSVNLANRLESRLGVRVPVARLVQGPSIEQLADDLLIELLPGAAPASVPAPPAGRGEPVSVTRGNGWLVFPRPDDSAPCRLFCFNFAGGGAASFRSWAALLAPSVELVAIEPPGRGSRIEEPSTTRLEAFIDAVMGAMRPYLDKPCAFYGHCLGGLTLFETARRLLASGPVDLVQLFVSGARPPHRVAGQGPFEENLLRDLLGNAGYDPLRSFHEQPDETFARILRHFNIWATDALLAQRELRALLLPAIRADFALAAHYRFAPVRPWPIPITCFNGLDDPYVTREDAIEWNRYTESEFRLHLRKGNHFLVVEDHDFIVRTIKAELAGRAGTAGRRGGNHA